VIDTDTSTDEIDPILLGEGDEVKRPYGGIAVSPSGEFVYVGNYGDGTVSVIGIYDETTP
jgi:DNA-binding beta-propeller fold protein YncE